MALIEEKLGCVTFKQAIRDFFKGYTDFSGRSTRAGFWWVFLIEAILGVGVLAGGVTAYQRLLQQGEERQILIGMGVGVLVALVMLILIMPNLALQFRRARDTGLRGRGLATLWVLGILFGIWYRQSGGLWEIIWLFGYWMIHLGVITVWLLPTDYLTCYRGKRVTHFFLRKQGKVIHPDRNMVLTIWVVVLTLGAFLLSSITLYTQPARDRWVNGTHWVPSTIRAATLTTTDQHELDQLLAQLTVTTGYYDHHLKAFSQKLDAHPDDQQLAKLKKAAQIDLLDDQARWHDQELATLSVLAEFKLDRRAAERYAADYRAHRQLQDELVDVIRHIDGHSVGAAQQTLANRLTEHDALQKQQNQSLRDLYVSTGDLPKKATDKVKKLNTYAEKNLRPLQGDFPEALALDFGV